MSGFDAGRLIVWARTDEAMGHSAAVEMVAGQSLDNVDIDLDCAGVLGGVVVGEDGAPVVGAVVQADDATSALRASATSDTQGGFSIGPLCAGQYALTLRSSRHASESLRRDSKAAANASLPDPSARVTSLRLIADVTLRKISGRILDSAGGGVPDVRVVAEREGGAEVRFDRWEELPSAVSDTNGRFAACNAPS